jgi:hypothetical protein
MCKECAPLRPDARRRRICMLDLLIVIVTIVTFVAFIGFTEGCERL